MAEEVASLEAAAAVRSEADLPAAAVADQAGDFGFIGFIGCLEHCVLGFFGFAHTSLNAV